MKKLTVFVMAIFLLFPGIIYGYQVEEVKNGGSIKGKVKSGKKVDDPAIMIDKDVEFCGKSQKALKYLLSPSLEVKNVLVIVEDVQKGKAAPKQDLMIDNKKCYFDPLVAIAYKGSKFVMKNSDPILHNTSLGLLEERKGKTMRKTLYNLAFPPERKPVIEKPVRVDGLIGVKCDAHPFMRAYIYASDHPYVAVTDGKGDFEIRDLLPGKYTLKFWHEGFNVVTQQVEVKAGATSEMSVTLKR